MSGTAEHGRLPPFLVACIESGVLAQGDAEVVDRFRRSSGTGLARALVASDLDDEAVGRIVGAHTPPDDSYLPLLLQQQPDPRLTFEALVPFQVNALALQIANAAATGAELRSEYNPFMVQAGLGLGKTHLLSAVANAASERNARLINVGDLDAEHERATKLGARAQMRHWLCGADLLLLDDLQLCQGKQALQQEIFALLNQMTQRGKLVLLSSNVAAEDLAVEGQLHARITSGLVVTLKLGNRREREAVVRRFLQHCTVPDSVVRYLAKHVTDNVRRLRAATTQLAAMHESLGVELTVELARAVAPQPEDLHTRPFATSEPDTDENSVEVPPPDPPKREPAVDRFKQMLASAETEQEQILALQIVLGERVRQMREQGGDAQVMRRLEHALELLREGNIEEAIRQVGGAI